VIGLFYFDDVLQFVAHLLPKKSNANCLGQISIKSYCRFFSFLEKRYFHRGQPSKIMPAVEAKSGKIALVIPTSIANREQTHTTKQTTKAVAFSFGIVGSRNESILLPPLAKLKNKIFISVI
jgi:hypothetical protein